MDRLIYYLLILLMCVSLCLGIVLIAEPADLLFDQAEDISVNDSSFSGVLDPGDSDVQACLNKIDTHGHTPATISDSYLLNTGDTGVGSYAFTGNVTIGDGDNDNPQLNFLGAVNKYIKYDHATGTLIIHAGKVVIE